MKSVPKTYIWGGTDSDGTDTHKVICPFCKKEIMRGKFVVAVDVPTDGMYPKRYILVRKAPEFHCGQMVAVPLFFSTPELAEPARISVEEVLEKTAGDIARSKLDFLLFDPRQRKLVA